MKRDGTSGGEGQRKSDEEPRGEGKRRSLGPGWLAFDAGQKNAGRTAGSGAAGGEGGGRGERTLRSEIEQEQGPGGRVSRRHRR